MSETREEREKKAWSAMRVPGHIQITSDDMTWVAGLGCPPLRLVELRDALNHRIRELGVEDPLEKEIEALKEIKAAWENYE